MSFGLFWFFKKKKETHLRVMVVERPDWVKRHVYNGYQETIQ